MSTDVLTGVIRAGLMNLQMLCGSTAASKGFHDDRPESYTTADRRDLANWQGNKLLLIVSEVIEAHDEIRSGHAADETYYPSKPDLGENTSVIGWTPGVYKPEGVPSEIADAVIRCFDFAYTEGFSLADIILEKLQFNSQRPYKHGRSF
jgi:hypothetical protein